MPITSRSHSLPTTTQLAIALQFLATGSFQNVIASSHGISQPSVSRCIAAVTDALCLHAKEFIVFPKQEDQLTIQRSFQEKDGFPLVLGCIDCSHVPIVAPLVNEAIFINRKNAHSINIQAICDRNVKFVDVVAKWPGSTHDAFIWRQSGINQKIASGDIPTVNGWFLGDSGYPLCPRLLTPLLSPNTPGERRYNRAFLKTRRNVECAFGLWKSRWRSMDKTGGTLCYTPERTCKLVVATMMLHNICILHRLQLEQELFIDIQEDDEVFPHDPASSGQVIHQSVINEYFN